MDVLSIARPIGRSPILQMSMAGHERSQPLRSRVFMTAAAMLGCALAAFTHASPAGSSRVQARPSQYDVEAAYLLDFGKFMHLTAASQALRRATFDICILGRDPMAETIDELALDETIDGRSVRVIRIGDVAQARTCAIAFISAYDDDSIRSDLSVLAGADVLTVGDAPDFIRDGGMIQFVLQKDHVRFAVNLVAVQKTHLVLSSQLMQVALYVTGKPPMEGAP